MYNSYGQVFCILRGTFMPIYDYLCDECGHKVEEFQSIHADALAKCPECDSETFHRVIGVPMLIRVSGSTTIGALADRNASRFSQEHKDSLLKKQKTRKQRSGKEMPAGMSRDTSEATPLQWPGETKDTDTVSQMTPEQKKEYIEDG
jgi:putative FmdB family regulatory protein